MASSFMGEIFGLIRKQDGDRVKIESILQMNSNRAFLAVLKFAYSPEYTPIFASEDDLPEYNPDPNPYGLNYSSMYQEWERFQYFFKETNVNGSKIDLKGLRRLYINICERLNADEAAIFTKIVTGQLYIKGLDAETINRAYGKTVVNLERPHNVE